jgi:predicted RNA-binding protein
MKYRIYSCCTEEGSKDFDKPARLEGVRDTLNEVEEFIAVLAERGKDAWYETEEDED